MKKFTLAIVLSFSVLMAQAQTKGTTAATPAKDKDEEQEGLAKE